jgi:N-acetylglucosamine-6-phosphate deacetylase
VIVLAGGSIVLPDRVLPDASVLIDGSHIVDIVERGRIDSADAQVIDVSGSHVVPGFIDVHVHGVEGHDTLDGGDAVREIAMRLPRYGVTAFCPTSVACPPNALRAFCDQVRRARLLGVSDGARVLSAHLESNFINPEYRGAQPPTCLRLPGVPTDGDFSARDIMTAISMARADIGIVTIAPELPGGLDLVRSLVAVGHRVSLGHSGADYDTAIAAIDAGARHATHLFNRMTPMTHRAPGLVGAILARAEIAAEVICDGHHVHPAMCRMAIAAKGVARVMAITDGTAGSGLPVGSTAKLGGRAIRVTDVAATLDDGTLAGSTLTMDRAFRNLVMRFGMSIVDAAALCSTSAARELGLPTLGAIERDATADLVVLDRDFNVLRTFVDGQQVFPRTRDEHD